MSRASAFALWLFLVRHAKFIQEVLGRLASLRSQAPLNPVSKAVGRGGQLVPFA